MMRILTNIEEARSFLRRTNSQGDSMLGAPALSRLRAVFGASATPESGVAQILQEIRDSGDEAIRRYSREFDPNYQEIFEVEDFLERNWHSEIDQNLRVALELSASRIQSFARSAMPLSWYDDSANYGIVVKPLERVGIYAPGGTAAYPSTVLMNTITAQVAGVDEVILCTPKATPSVMYAARLGGVSRVFQIGGAHAIAGMAYGTQSISRVDKICGPGNLFVVIAKRQVYGEVDIDGLYGPTETVIIADATANPILCAADLLAQAEHDPMAIPIMVTTSRELARMVDSEIRAQLPLLDRSEIATSAVEDNGALIVVADLQEAADLTNYFAPEHVSVMVAKPSDLDGQLRHVGGIFVGEYSPEVIGDYVAGPSHTMPTGGSARFSSYLGVQQFLRFVPIVALDRASFDDLAESAKLIAESEGLTAHARAVVVRKRENPNGETVSHDQP